MTSKILENHYRQISPEGVITIISKLYRRIKSEIEKLNTGEKNNTLDLINCLRIFSNILVEMKEDDRESLEAQSKSGKIIA